MPWCPICRSEYREGITECADCKSALVDELQEEKNTAVLSYIANEALAEKLVKFLEYSKIKTDTVFNEERQAFEVSVEKDKLEEAKTAFSAVYTVETENEVKNALASIELYDEDDETDEGILEENLDEEISTEDKERLLDESISRQVYKPARVYVKKADESKEMFSTAVTFIMFAVFLLVFLILNAFDIITWFNSLPALIVIGVMAAACSLVGINAVKRSKKAEEDAVEEEKLTSLINTWMDDEITKEFLFAVDDPEASEEVNYLKRIDAIKEKMEEAFDGLDDDYADNLIEEFYNSHFDN